MTGRLLSTRGRRLSALVSALAVLALAGGALAYFAATGTGSASASVGSINPPPNASAQQTGADVTISWAAATLSSGGAVQGYRVKRSDGATVCGTPTPVTTLSCTDTSVPDGKYTYTSTAVFNSFTASATSGSVTITRPAPTITSSPSDLSANAAPSFSFGSSPVLAWGYNTNGQLGDNSTTDSSVPVTVLAGEIPAGTKITQVAAGGDFYSLALSSTGQLYAWGYNGFGELGNNSTTDSPVPVAVSAGEIPAGTTITQVAAGSHSLALSSTGQLYAWGYNAFGQLGNNSTTNSSVPVAVSAGEIPAGTTITQVAAGYVHSLALSSTGQLYAWGSNSNGQLGNNSTTDSSVPVAVSAGEIPAGTTITQIAAGASYSLALSSTGQLYAWGSNSNGQLGDNSTTDSSVPVAVSAGEIPAGTTITQIAAGDGHSLALSSTGPLYAWGSNSNGQLGDNSTTDSSVPVAVSAGEIPAGTTITQIAGGASHSLALSSTGQLYAWGSNSVGQLGDNSTTDSPVPVAVSQPSGIAIGALASGSSAEHVLALDGGSFAATTYECQLDGSSFTSCSSPNSYSGLSDGPHTFKVHATTAGATSPDATYNWTIDTTAPSITAKPSEPSANGSPSFSFTRTQTAYTFQCQIDGSGFRACSSPYTAAPCRRRCLGPLSDGSHTIDVVAVSADGATTTAASYTWTVDSSAPTITAMPSDPSVSAAPSFSFSHAQAGYTFQCQLDGGGYTACTSPRPYTSLADGSHTFQVQGIDADGIATSVASYTWTVDSSAPQITAKPGNPSANPAPSFSFTHTQAGYTFKCQLDNAGYTACTSPQSYSALAGGSHSFQVQALSADGATTTAASYTWTVDTSAPSISAKPANPSANAAPSFSFNHAQSAYTFTCQLDGGGYTACTSSKTYSTLSDGSHTFQVQGIDSDGISTVVVSYTWTVDTTAPSITAKPADPSPSAAPSFSFTHTRSAYAFKCQVDSGGYAACASPKSCTGLANGSHTFQVKGIDGDGIATLGASYTWTVDTTTPTITSVVQPTGYQGQTLIVTINGSGFESTGSGASNNPQASFSNAGITVNSTTYNSPTQVTANITIAGRATTGPSTVTVTDPNGASATDSGAVFWSVYDTGAIGRANRDGSGASSSFISGGSNPHQVTTDSSYVYWANYNGTIGRATLSGGVQDQSYATDSNPATGVAVDGSYIYWANRAGNSIGRENLNSPFSPNPAFISGASTPEAVVVNGSYVYWINVGAGTIGRATLNGVPAPGPGQTGSTFISGIGVGDGDNQGLAVDGSFIYWANRGGTTLGRANLDGTGVTPSFISNGVNNNSVSNPTGVAVDGSYVYWANGSGTIGRATLSGVAAPGSGLTGSTLISGLQNLQGVAVNVPFTIVADTTAPTGGALSVNGTAASTSGSSSVAHSASFTIGSRSDYADSQSGLKSSTLTVQSETLTGSTCGAPGSGGPFTTPTTVSGTTQPAGIATGYCYLYTLTGTDNVGNTTSIMSTVTVQTYRQVVAVTASGGPVSLWLLNDAAGSTTAVDSIGSSPMTANNSISPSPQVGFGSVPAPAGMGGTAASFSGNGNYLHTSAPVTTTTTTWALEAWLNPAAATETSAFALFNGSDGIYPTTGGYGFGEGSGTYGWTSNTLTGSCVQILEASTAWAHTLGEPSAGCYSPGWNYVEVSSNGTGYVNNVPFTFTTTTYDLPTCATTIGTELNANCGFLNGRQFTGSVAGAAVYTHVLSSADALAHYNAGH